MTVLNGMPSDHKVITCNVNVSRPQHAKIKIRSRKLRNIDVAQFSHDIGSTLSSVDVNLHLAKSVDRYEKSLQKLLDKHAPMKERTVILRHNALWYNHGITYLELSCPIFLCYDHRCY